jgi:hypothetical protein
MFAVAEYTMANTAKSRAAVLNESITNRTNTKDTASESRIGSKCVDLLSSSYTVVINTCLTAMPSLTAATSISSSNS